MSVVISKRKGRLPKPKPCIVCGKEFQATTFSALCCSKQCAKNRELSRKREFSPKGKRISDAELVRRMDEYLAKHADITWEHRCSPIAAMEAWA